MNLLELCNRVRQESGVSTPELLTAVSQQGIIAKIVAWVQQAYVDVTGMRPDWQFLWRTADATLVANQQLFSAVEIGLSDMEKVISFQIGTAILKPISWQDFKTYGYSNNGKTGKPQGYAIRPDGLIAFYPTPDQSYTVPSEYSKKVEPLLLDDDEPLIPVNYHDVIVQKALMYYASHEEDNSLYQVASLRYEDYLTKLAANCVAPIVFPHSNGGLY